MSFFKLSTVLFIILVAHPDATYCQQNVLPAEGMMRSDIEFLASDKLGGRLAGSEDEKVAAQFIRNRFESMGLTAPANMESFYSDFSFPTPLKYAEDGNFLNAGKREFQLDDEFYIVPISGNGKCKGRILDISFGISAPELNHNDLENISIKDRIVLVNLGSPDGIHPHSKFTAYHSWHKRLEDIAEMGPSAILCHNSEGELSLHALRRFNNLKKLSIPVIYVEDKALEILKEAKRIHLGANLEQEHKLARNVLGYINRDAEKTVVIGAHYDHLGLGEYGNSRYVGAPEIHNGADDNASGVALMLSLAGRLKAQEGSLKHNYLFIAFSAEELGLLGSNAFVHTEVFKKYDVLYMLNFDMVGRLNDMNELGLYGTGTSKTWARVFSKLDTSNFQINRKPSGMGSSDHTSFYLNDIPVLHYFTGTHSDYHKPSDDIDKINFNGMLKLLQLSTEMCLTLDEYDEIDFRKTKTGSSQKAPSFKVTLGIIPDYMGDSRGLKIDGVSEGKPAEAAGLVKGDIIIKLGDKDVSDMMTYMEALGVFDKGDVTTVKILRDTKEMEFRVIF